MITKSRLR